MLKDAFSLVEILTTTPDNFCPSSTHTAVKSPGVRPLPRLPFGVVQHVFLTSCLTIFPFSDPPPATNVVFLKYECIYFMLKLLIIKSSASSLEYQTRPCRISLCLPPSPRSPADRVSVSIIMVSASLCLCPSCCAQDDSLLLLPK